ncbi:hypothetical protein AAHC03_01994 [Spirometra sp. Aus1]
MAESTVEPLDFYHLLDELESDNSGSCANVIRKLREHEVAAYQAGVGGPTGGLIANFIALLDERVADKELEIEKACSHNYQSFVDSVKELLCVQEEAEKLQSTLSEIRSSILDEVQKLNESFTALSASQSTLEQIDQCIAALQNSLPVLDQYERIEKSIADGRYYHALKTLEHLEHYQLKSIQSYTFSACLLKRIPELRAEIKSASLAQLTDFLEEIRKHSVRLGAITMRRIAEKIGMKDDFLANSETKQQHSHDDGSTSDVNDSDESHCNQKKPGKSKVLEAELKELAAASIPMAPDDPNNTSPWGHAKTNIEDVVNFGPVYRCLHIYAVAGERAEFEHYYFTQRKKQCQLILSLSPSQQASLRNYSEFFSTLVGFFLLDDYLRHTMPGAGSSYQTYLNDLWGHVVPKLVQFATKNAESCKTNSELLCLKHYSVLFEYTMAHLGFHTAGLSEMLEAVRKRYNALLIGQWREKLTAIVADDNYTAITLNSSKDLIPPLSTYLSSCSPEFSALAYPRVLAFSPMVPKIYMAIRDYIDACFVFVENVDLSLTELEDTLSRATNCLFTECLDDIVNRMITDSEKDLLRLIQLTINLNELESACEHLQAYLHENARPRFCTDQTSKDLEDSDLMEDFKAAEPDDLSMVHPSRSHLYGVSLFKDARARSETQIYTILNARIEEFCSLATYEGIFGGPGEGNIPFDELISRPTPLPPPKEPSGYMKDLTAWLGSTFSAFTNLPPKVAQTACISASKHIVRLLQNILMGPSVKMVTEPALTQFALDLAECEKFAKSEPVPGIDKFILVLIFQELSQLFDLIKKEDWSVYFSKHNKSSGNPYDRVTPAAAINLLERMREAEKKKSSFLGSIKKEERERRKNLEKVICQLKDLSGRR